VRGAISVLVWAMRVDSPQMPCVAVSPVDRRRVDDALRTEVYEGLILAEEPPGVRKKNFQASGTAFRESTGSPPAESARWNVSG